VHSFYETVFLGGGISCLAAARAFRGDSILFEREDRVGGLCRTERIRGFCFDRTGHLLHLQNPEIERLVGRLLEGNLVSRIRNSWVYSHGVYTRYPFQSNFFGLPPEVAAECLLGVIRAREKRQTQKNFAGWVLSTFGEGVARHFMFPYNQKLWTVPPRVLTTGWMGRFVPRPDLKKVIAGALADAHDDAGYNAFFLYPRSGGIESLVEVLAKGVKRTVCGVGVKRIDLKSRRLTLTTGDRVGFGRLVSCAPLPELVKMTRPVPERVRTAARKLRWSSVYNLNLGIRDRGSDRHWVYVPEDRYAVYRFGYASNFSDRAAPEGRANVYTEVAYSRRRPLDRSGIRNRVIRDLTSIGVLRSKRDVLVTQENDLGYAYAIYDRNRSRAVSTCLRFFESRDIHPVGRYGRWEYGTMEDALIQGIQAAKLLKK
jgi:protoporphyrinogen oxidase